MTLVQPIEPIEICNPQHQPSNANGEKMIDIVLHRLWIPHSYETRFYTLQADPNGQCKFGFRPDYVISDDCGRIICHVEITWADKISRTRSGTPQEEIFELKFEKITQTYAMHGIPTLLVDYRTWRAIKKRNRLLRRLIKELMRTHEDRNGFFRPSNQELALFW